VAVDSQGAAGARRSSDEAQYTLATKSYHLHVHQRQEDVQAGLEENSAGHFDDSPYAALYEGAFVCEASMRLYAGMFSLQFGEAWTAEMRAMHRQRMLKQALRMLAAGMHTVAQNQSAECLQLLNTCTL
jgi:hypothetical protein